ncbi:serrate RNA effector molecule homolog isoform X1 [Lucilia sericata]|uniref:serrate RNA effector molecule homolog isoform X1 n=2 Tax=Lucilia sericata TaxID=13632 RepID=UPI0018A81613|nr:serrate RNA effector molecule homolog isoform X1 [Lucilia sericata]
MADSDDEYDRKRRDKFRGERSSGDSYRSERRDDRRGGGSGGGRDDWPERGNPFRGGAASRARSDYRDFRGPRDRYGSPGREMPPAKRMRQDWGDDLRGNPRFGPYDPYLMHAWNEHYAAHGLHGAYSAALSHSVHSRESAANTDLQTQPAMMTLKQFLDTQDDGISDTEVLRKYNEYKLEFKRQQLNEFFVAHKDEEWFKNKYHPVDSVKRKEEQLNFLKRRVEVFDDLLKSGMIEKVSVDTTQTEPLLRVLDTVVIKLEGGTDDDLKILDEKPKEASYPERVFDKKNDNDDDVIITSVEKKHNDEPKCVSPRPINRHKKGSDDEDNWDEEENDEESAKTKAKEKSEEKKKKSIKRKRTSSDSSSSSSSDSDSSSSSSSSEDEDDEKVKSKYDLESLKKEDDVEMEDKKKEEEKMEEDKEEEKEKEDSEEKKEEKEVTNDEETKDKEEVKENGEETESKALTNDAEEKPEKLEGEEKSEDKSADTSLEEDKEEKKEEAEKEEAKLEEEEKAKDEEQPETIDLDKVKDGPQPRALHRTSSIFLRNLAPSITKAEIEAVCQKFDGYLRVAIADPLVERRWYRRGWVTFKRDVNIKEICWNLNNTRLRDCEMGAIVNRDLSRRVRPVNGMTAHKTIVRADIKLCAKIAMNLDEKFKLWQAEKEENKEENASSATEANASTAPDANNELNNSSSSYGFKTNNPVLQNITDFLIEEASAEEEELLGISGDNKDSEGEAIERDPQLLTVLDNLILYLRIVHSVDFYNHCEYPYEDEMPNRCGIIHARGPPPAKVSQNDMQDYIKNFESKMQTFLAKSTPIEEEELKNLGSKDTEAEVEKFIQANTQELAKDKWLCPLSGKKFKGPEFIRKHIFNKHAEKVEEVRKEVEFFNNYLKDPKRPQLPEHPGNNKRTTSESSGGYRAPVYPPAYAPPYAAYAPPLMIPGRGARGFGGPGRRELPIEHQRRIIGYHDLDAPANFDIFD